MSVAAFNDWSLSVTALALPIVWQSALLACLVAGVCRLLRGSAPALRYWCWQIVAIKLLLMPWWIVAIPLPGFVGVDMTRGPPFAARRIENHGRIPFVAAARQPPQLGEKDAMGAGAPPGAFEPYGNLTWRAWLVLVWLAGIAYQLGRMVVQRRRLQHLLSRMAPATEPRLLAAIEQVAAQLGLARRPTVLLTNAEGAPFVFGLWRPVLVLPRSLMAELDPEHWRDVVLHELGHVKRCDLWWSWLPAIARMIYFFDPVAHWVWFRIRLERELACDQLAMKFGGRSAVDYAGILVHVVSHASMPAALTLGSLEGLSSFWKRRLTMLLATSQSSPRLSRRVGLAAVTAAVMACLMPTMLLAPAVAEPQPAASDAKSKGRIYVMAGLAFKGEGENEEKPHYNLIIAIDPATGKWQKMTGNGNSSAATARAEAAPRVSPDGQTLVFLGPDGMCTCDTDGSNNPGTISDKGGCPVWSPDGKHLVATEQEYLERDDKPSTSPSWKDETRRMDADGSNLVKLPIPDTDWVADWSPDGQWFVTGSDRHRPFGRGYQLYLMKTDGTQQRRLTKNGLNVYSRFSPDGKKILYVHQTGKEGNSIWTMDIDGKNAREIVKEIGLASPNGAFWSPDGKQIAVILFNWELDENGKKTSRLDSDLTDYRIVIMNADGTNPRRLKLEGAKFVFIGSLGDWR